MRRTTYLNLFLTGIFSLLFLSDCEAQQLKKSRRSSYYTYIFKVNTETVEAMNDLRAIDYSKCLGAVIDSFPTDQLYSKKLPDGNYLYQSIVDNEVKYRLVAFNNLQVKLSNQQKWHSLIVADKNGNALTDVGLKVDKRHIPFNSQTQSFNFLYKKDEGLITVSYNGNIYFYEYSSNEPEYDNFFEKFRESEFCYCLKSAAFATKKKFGLFVSWFSGNDIRTYTGYMVFNKPKYLPGDTIKIKSFIVYASSGKPVQKKLQLFLYSRYDDDPKKSVTALKPVSSGSYIYEFVLPDSLKPDVIYTLGLYASKKKDALVSEDFRLQDYQLREANYKLYTKEDEYHLGESIPVYIKAEDANGLPLMDASVELTIEASRVQNMPDRTVFVPETLWTHEQALDPLGETKIIIPDRVIPPINMSVSIKALFKNGNNELHNTTETVDFIAHKDFIKVWIADGNIFADYVENNRATEKEVTVRLLDENDDIIDTRKARFPFKEKINPFASDYEFESGSVNKSISIEERNRHPQVDFIGYRTADSVFVRLDNPFKLPVRYRIMCGHKTIQQGIGDSLFWKKQDRTQASYYILFNYVWGGEMISRYINIHLLEKQLNIQLQQPQDVYPGQQADVKIKVTDYKNRPVQHVNLTAMAVNKQFESTTIPWIPYLGKKKRDFLHFYNPNLYRYRENAELDDLTASDRDTVSTSMMKRTGVDSILFYKFSFPENGAFYFYDSICSTNAQFSPYMVESGKILQPLLIYLDNKLIYAIESNVKRRYAFIGKPGYHNIRVRTKNKEYRIDSVLLKRGYKLDFSIDARHLPKNVSITSMPETYTDTENGLLRTSLMVLRYKSYNKPAFLWQDDNVWLLEPDQSGSITIGPLEQTTTHFAIKDEYQSEFVFEWGYEYLFSEKTIKLFESAIDYRKIKHSNRYTTRIPIGETAYSKKDIVLKTNTLGFTVRFSDPPIASRAGTGKYNFVYHGDSSIYAIKLFKPVNVLSAKFYEGKFKILNDLDPGYYTLLLITPFGNCFKKDSIQIKGNGTVYDYFDNINFYGYDSNGSASRNSTPPHIPEGVGSIRGSVTEQRESIPGVTIALYSEGELISATITDINGNYSLPNLPFGNYKLVLAAIGYLTMESTTGIYTPLTKLTHELTPDKTALKEIVVTAMGVTRSLKSVSYSTQTVNGSALSIRGISSNPLYGYSDSVKRKFRKISLNETYKDAKQLRNRFSDYAYWQPNLLTDEKGEASFKAAFPDNITQWNSYVLAMDGKKHAGTGFTSTRSYKKLVASLSVPRFLIEGDETSVIGKSLNYLNDSLSVRTSFKINANSTPEKIKFLKDAWIETTRFKVETNDSVKVSYTLQAADGYADGEEEKIPVFPKGVEEVSGSFHVLKKDTMLTLDLKADNCTYELYAQDDALQMMLAELDKLENYPYSCNEQTASKLMGLLMEKRIRTQLQQSFKKDQQIRKLIKKLEDNQQTDGSWGWWGKSAPNSWMTAYVSQALYKAHENGFQVEALERAVKNLNYQLDILKGSNLLFVLNVLSEMMQQAPYTVNLSRLKQDSLSTYQKLMIIHIRQQQQLEYDTLFLEKHLKTDILGNTYVKRNLGNPMDWFENDIQLTLLGYQILSKQKGKDSQLESIRNYFLSQKRNGGWRNTIETARIVEAILPDVLNTSNPRIPAVLTISGNVLQRSVNQFPFRTTIYPATLASVSANNTSLVIKKTGSSQVYFTLYKKYWNSHPEKSSNNFEVSTSFKNQNGTLKELKAGRPATLIVDVKANREAEYVMIEVPIPAGCSYANDRISVGEAHREYLKNKTLIFCEKLTQGYHQFSIDLEPRFSGTYTLNPAKVELMYFPTFYGREEIKKTVIAE